MKSKIIPAEAAREKAGFTLEQAARIARLHPRRLRSYELNGGATDAVARRLCHFYGAGSAVFNALLFGPTEKTSKKIGVIASSRNPRATGKALGVAAPVPTKSRRKSPSCTSMPTNKQATGRKPSENRSGGNQP